MISCCRKAEVIGEVSKRGLKLKSKIICFRFGKRGSYMVLPHLLASRSFVAIATIPKHRRQFPAQNSATEAGRALSETRDATGWYV